MLNDDFLWVEKYRPKSVSDTILPKQLKEQFQSFVDQKNIPTLLLVGEPGVGKTTIARAMLEEMGSDYIVINGSLEGRLIDTLRTKIQDFASTVSFAGGRKYVIVDEADFMNPQSVQPSLRNFIETYSDNCGFIFTANYKNKIIPAVANSRCVTIEFKYPKSEAGPLASQFLKRCIEILNKENITHNKAAVAEVVSKFYPDWRRVLNELQRYAASGNIDTGILVNLKDIALKEVCDLLKNKKFKEVRKWVSDNSDVDSNSLFTSFFEHAHSYLKKTSVPILVLLLAKYQYQAAFVANQEINNVAFFVEIMTECEWE